MTEDPTRALPRQADPATPTHGRVGPADPSADPVTHPALVPVPAPTAGDSPTVPTPTSGLPAAGPPTPGSGTPAQPSTESAVARTRTAVLWIGVMLSAVVLIFLLIFIVQNNVPVRINFLGAAGTLPTGVALLFAAIAGLLLVAIPAGLRILQLRRAARRSRTRR
jgi:uncharacterized integral membrane protein